MIDYDSFSRCDLTDIFFRYSRGSKRVNFIRWLFLLQTLVIYTSTLFNNLRFVADIAYLDIFFSQMGSKNLVGDMLIATAVSCKLECKIYRKIKKSWKIAVIILSNLSFLELQKFLEKFGSPNVFLDQMLTKCEANQKKLICFV